MSGLSPASVLYSSDGYELATINGNAIPTGNRGLLVEGSDGTNSRFITVDTSGRVVTVGAGVAGTPAGGVLSIQGVAGGTPVPISGTVTAANASVGTDGAASLTSDTQVGGITTTAAPTYTTGNLDALSLTTKGGLRIDGVFATGAAVPLSDAMYVGAAVTTAAPAYTTGQMDPLSLTTAGLLRIDGVYPLAATTPTSDGVFIAAAVTTAAPAYTTGQLDGLSLNTSGGLRIDGVSATAATTGGTAMLSGGAVTTAAPAYTSGQMDPLSLTTAGLLRIDGVYPINATTPTTDVVFVGGAVTTAAPTYTTGQLSALSLDTAGNLRVTALTNKAATSNVTSVAGATSTTSILASNTSRVFGAIYNNTNKNMYVLLGSGTASTSNFSTLLMQGVYWELPVDYVGAVQAIWASGVSGSALVTELTP